MNDYKIMLNKLQQQYLSQMLPTGFSFQLYKVRKNINNYPFKEFDKKCKKTDSIILNKKDSFVVDSIQPSEISIKDKSEPIIVKEQLKPIQITLLGLVKKIRKHESSYPFRNPVDPKALQIPDYFDVVLEPIDLKTIEDKIRRDQYEHLGEFQRDIYKMIMNSYKYNQKASSTQKKTIQFEEFYVQMMKQFHSSKTVSENGDKDIVKEQMVDERKEDQVKKAEEYSLSQEESAPKQVNAATPVESPPVNIFVAAKTVKQQPRQNSKLFKVLTEIANQKPKPSKKHLPKPLSASNIPKSKSPKKLEPKIKIQQPQDDFSQQFLPVNQLVFSQQIEPTQQKDLESEQIKEEMKSYLENETQNNKQQIFSQGFNQATLGGRIRNIEVQKQITGLLKRLSEFPLTKQKKIKNVSKFTNLEHNMTQTDKKKLYEKIVKLDENDIQCVVKILTKGKCDTSKLQEFEIDLDKVDSKILREVQNFIVLRDMSFAASANPTQVTGSMPLNFQLQPIVPQVPKIPKKAKKQQKKNMKKKISRKNSNDDSFSLNPPPIKKKKSQKPLRKNVKNDEKSQVNGQGHQSLSEKEESSSYHPEPLHHQHHGKVMGSHLHQRSQQAEKLNHIYQKLSMQNRKKSTIESQKQKEKTPRPQYHDNHLSHNHSYHHSPHHYHNEDRYDDIDQFLAIENQHPQEDNRSKKRLTSFYDLQDFNNFGIGSEIERDYQGQQMKEINMYQNQKEEQNDEDHFF